jgi:hypothetical protein
MSRIVIVTELSEKQLQREALRMIVVTPWFLPNPVIRKQSLYSSQILNRYVKLATRLQLVPRSTKC